MKPRLTCFDCKEGYRLTKIAKPEVQVLSKAKSLITPISAYMLQIADPRVPINAEVAQDILPVMRTALALQYRTLFEMEEEDWISKANAMDPFEFSVLFDVGEPDPRAQKICRDVKLMDTLFKMTTAPYDRVGSKNPWSTDAFENFAGPKAIEKFAYVILQRMCEGNTENQNYFGRKTLGDGLRWVDRMMQTLEDPLGAAVTLSKLLSQNELLMQKYATPALVLRILEMIQDCGPETRFLKFLGSFCSVEKQPVKANQELILRLSWINDAWRAKVFLKTCSFEWHRMIQHPISGDETPELYK